MLLNSEAFVRDRFGAAAHQRVLAGMPPESTPRFSTSLPDGARVPMEQLVAYMKTARALLAPDDGDFFREMGRFAGARDRDERAFSHMVADRATILRMMKVLWSTFYSEGTFEILESDEQSATGRAVGFTGDPVLCDRICGVAETQLRVARIEHVACVFRGDPACAWTVWW
jgi:hypothetical protein